MEILYRGRGTGKTTALIYASALTRIPILTSSSKHGDYIKKRAKELNLSIPEPLTAEDIRLGGKMHGMGITQVFADDAEVLLEKALHEYLGVDVQAITLTWKMSDIL